jgi:hypothetical protein
VAVDTTDGGMVNKKRENLSESECIGAIGPWPFTTRRTYRSADGSLRVWSSRHHRKSLTPPEVLEAIAFTETLLRCLWMPKRLNWWIGIVFALGALLFALASLLSLSPDLAALWSMKSSTINAIFFAGSIPFTTAAYLQLFQAANAGEFLANHPRSGQRASLFGWRPRDIGWLSCALQLVGTILFNFNTFDAMIPSLTWFEEDLVIWAPNIIGSILFLASGYLAFIETCHAHWAWKPKSISWWVVFTNLLGCAGFMISAVFAIVLPGTPNIEVITISVLFTLLGAIGFLVGSLLMLPEAISQPESL